MVSSSKHMVSDTLVDLMLSKLVKYNDTGAQVDAVINGIKQNISHSAKYDEMLLGKSLSSDTGNFFEEVSKIFVTKDTVENQKRFVLNLITKLEEAIVKGEKSVKVGGSTLNLTEEFISEYRILFDAEKQVIKNMASELPQEVKQISDAINSSTEYKDLPKFAKDFIDNASKVATARYESELKVIENQIEKISKIKKEGSEETAELLFDQSPKDKLRELKLQADSIEKKIQDIAKSSKGEDLRNVSKDLLKDWINQPEIMTNIGEKVAESGIKEVKADKWMALFYSSQDGVRNAKAYNDVNSALKTMRGFAFNPDKNATFKGVVKNIGSVFTLWSIYSTIGSVVGESITNYRLMLGAQAATNALITEFIVYRGEPYLSNLEGLTRNSSKLISPDTSYNEYLRSRFFNFDEMGDFLANAVNLSVKASLTQYTDILLSSNIDDGLFQSSDSGLKFASSSDSNQYGGPGLSVNVVAGTLANPIASAQTKSMEIDSAFGWRLYTNSKGKQEVDFHHGVDIISSAFTDKHKDSSWATQNAVLSFEDGFILYNNASGKEVNFSLFSPDLNAPGYGLEGDNNNLTLSGLYLYGLTTGILWTYIHIMPTIGGQDNGNIKAGAKARYTKGGQTVAAVGPFGISGFPHLHINAWQVVNNPKSNIFSSMLKLYRDTVEKNKSLSPTEQKDPFMEVQKAFPDPSKDLKIPFVGRVPGPGTGDGIFEKIDPERILTDPKFKLTPPPTRKWKNSVQGKFDETKRVDYNAQNDFTDYVRSSGYLK